MVGITSPYDSLYMQLVRKTCLYDQKQIHIVCIARSYDRKKKQIVRISSSYDRKYIDTDGLYFFLIFILFPS